MSRELLKPDPNFGMGFQMPSEDKVKELEKRLREAHGNERIVAGRYHDPQTAREWNIGYGSGCFEYEFFEIPEVQGFTSGGIKVPWLGLKWPKVYAYSPTLPDPGGIGGEFIRYDSYWDSDQKKIFVVHDETTGRVLEEFFENPAIIDAPTKTYLWQIKEQFPQIKESDAWLLKRY